MNQQKDSENPQVFYMGRWVSREHFRAFVYNGTAQKLAESYDDYERLLNSGLWFASKDDVKPNEPVSIRAGRKPKHGADS